MLKRSVDDETQTFRYLESAIFRGLSLITLPSNKPQLSTRENCNHSLWRIRKLTFKLLLNDILFRSLHV